MKYIFFTLTTVLFLTNCNEENDSAIKLSGKAQGTTCQITYFSETTLAYSDGIDSIVKEIDLSLSTYVPASVISRINNNDSDVIVDDHFTEVFNKSVEVSQRTNGVFDMTVAPVINAWGFGFTKKAQVDSAMIDSLLDFIGYKMVRLEANRLIKIKPDRKSTRLNSSH